MGFVPKNWLSALDGRLLMEELHMSNLLIHMPADGTPQSQACTEHVLPGIYSREELEGLAAHNKTKEQ